MIAHVITHRCLRLMVVVVVIDVVSVCDSVLGLALPESLEFLRRLLYLQYMC